MGDHTRYAKQLPGNKTPDVPHEPLPAPLEVALREFLQRVAQVRGKMGRRQILSVKLAGWESFGGDLDRLDSLAGEYETYSVYVVGHKHEWIEACDKIGQKEPVGIFVNGRAKETMDDEISFSDVVRLAYDKFPSNARTLTVTYRGRSSGSLQHGSSVPVEAGMVFNVADTSNA